MRGNIKIIKSVREMQRFSRQIHLQGKTLGFVPTMGFLHEGHLSLVKTSKKKSDVTVVSIFINPTQFAPNEDFSNYPRDLKRDKELLIRNNVDLLFLPSIEEIYPENFQTYVEVNDLSKILEGKSRPYHFKGVTTIVAVLINSVKPDLLFLGQKDAQQAALIKQMVSDLKFDLRIIVCPIIREKDGLAMSSRNSYLTEAERKDASVLSKSLYYAHDQIDRGRADLNEVIRGMKEIIESVKSSKLDYINVVEADSFKPANKMEKGKEYFILTACKIGSTRLIDNIKIKPASD